MNLPKEVIILAKKFNESKFQLFAVGGSVRDLFIGRESHDWDFTTDATPEQILDLFPQGFYANTFGTVVLPIKYLLTDNIPGKTSANKSDYDPEEFMKMTGEVFDITTMRKESGYKDSRHPTEIEWTTNIEEDLARRDFTINALALPIILNSESNIDINQEKIVDPFDGLNDLKTKLIKAVGDPKKRFTEDALRLMRAIRFSTQLHFNIEENTLKAINENAPLIQNISWERIRDELFKILAAKDPYRGIILLRETGLLQIILPELERCFGVMQEGPKHDRIYDIGSHSLLSLKNCPSTDPLVRFAALIHDVGKPDTFDTQQDGNVTFYAHDIVGSKIAKKIGERLKLSRKEIDKLEILVRYHMFTVNEEQTDAAIRRFIKNIGLENINDMISIRIADRLGGGTETAVSWRMEEFRKRIDQVLEKPFSVADLKVTGTDVMEITGLKPSREVGDILQQLFTEVLEDNTKNDREYLIKRIKEHNV
jgi:putative nucleotidyltransferase with HDIG domain